MTRDFGLCSTGPNVFNGHVKTKVIHFDGAIRTQRQGIRILGATSHDRQNLVVREQDFARFTRGHGEYLEREGAAAFPFQKRWITRTNDIIDDTLENASGAVALDHFSKHELVFDPQSKA